MKSHANRMLIFPNKKGRSQQWDDDANQNPGQGANAADHHRFQQKLLTDIQAARTDADGTKLIRSDFDEPDKPFLASERTSEADYLFLGGPDAAVARCTAAAPYEDMVWCETMKPDLDEARRFAEAIHAKFPGKMIAIDCASPRSLKKAIGESNMERFHTELAAMGYKYQFITLAGFHSLNMSMFDFSREYLNSGVKMYADLQERGRRAAKEHGYRASKQAWFVGTG